MFAPVFASTSKCDGASQTGLALYSANGESATAIKVKVKEEEEDGEIKC